MLERNDAMADTHVLVVSDGELPARMRAWRLPVRVKQISAQT